MTDTFTRRSNCRRVCLTVWIAGLVATGWTWSPQSAAAQEPDLAASQTAQKLIDATVTVRVVGAESFVTASRGDQQEGPSASLAENEVTVCSGTYVGAGRLLSFGCLPVVEDGEAAKTEYRITLRAGEQARARPRVVDRYSGLVLLEVEGHRPGDLKALEVADVVPQTASAVLTAAASGLEQPLISQGVLSGVDRTVAGTDLPPMLVCDISTTSASSGAALVDQDARLFGIVAAASLPGESFGWTYAVPLKHIQRVLESEQEGQLVVLARVRPSLGVVLGPGADVGAVVVEQIDPGGPGDKAGIVVGDQIVAIEGFVVRSVYQAGALIGKHLPGDQIKLTCRLPVAREPAQGSQAATSGATAGNADSPDGEASKLVRVVNVTLGARADDAAISLPVDVQQQAIKARFTTPEQVEVSNSSRSYQFRVEPSTRPSAAASGAAQGADANVLHAQLHQYEELIQLLRQDAQRQRELLDRQEKLVEAVLSELQRLRAESDALAEAEAD